MHVTGFAPDLSPFRSKELPGSEHVWGTRGSHGSKSRCHHQKVPDKLWFAEGWFGTMHETSLRAAQAAFFLFLFLFLFFLFFLLLWGEWRRG